jgi:hypothetical protein
MQPSLLRSALKADLDTHAFCAVTGLQAPPIPITPKTYEALGLPFYKLYEESSSIHGAFDKVKSIGELDGVEERDYNILTTVINPQDKPEATNAATERDPEDISNPNGPFEEFYSIAEMVKMTGEMRLNAANSG